eukprot:TRINITY_DN119_c0_g1_i1.p1 TRINITY_DN119_c0_g1~~TRINITY_DN119_c0_g1_i1.p1  ORF type:complete len:479 (-),score=222.98 TRINITY_DN119_c0_g1_i1:77-1513(-)
MSDFDEDNNSPRRRSPSPGRSAAGAGVEEVINLSPEDVAFVLGRGGSTKRKIAAVSECQLEIDSDGRMELRGSEEQRRHAKEYVELVLAQRHGAVFFDLEDAKTRDDVSVFSVPRECVGYVTGRGGSALRSIEEEFGALMIFVKDKATEGQPGAGDRSADAEFLIIFGPRRARCGAKLKVMSAVEHKLAGEYTEDGHIRDLASHFGEFESGDEFTVDQVEIPDEEFSYALGRNGGTRKKLAAAANCILQYLGRTAVFAGTLKEVGLCKEYLSWLIKQRVGAVNVEWESRDDVVAVDVPSDFIGFVTGAKGAALREMEFLSATFMFSAGDREDRTKPMEKLLVFSSNDKARQYGKELVLHRIQLKEYEDAHPRRGYDDRGRGGYDDRGRGGYDDRGRGGYDDRGRGGYGGHDDRRGGHGGYDNRYDDRYRGGDRYHDDRYERHDYGRAPPRYDDRRDRSPPRYDDRRRQRSRSPPRGRY